LGDIEKAFLQLSLNNPDREVTKFLWVKNPLKPLTANNLMIYRFCRVAFGVISSPFLLAGVIRRHLELFKTPVAEELQKNTYVDNLLIDARSLDDALRKIIEIRKIFEDAKMNVREFVSNIPGFSDHLPEELRLNTETP